MIFVFYALLAALAWGVWFMLQLDLWIPLGVSGVMLFVAIVTFIYQRVKVRRSAAALEKALADQGQQQVMNARPERRAEIQALQKQISDGIGALKSSKLGGKKRGSAALYSLPWYAIIGPPGAGKTTALRHSGLVFPYADSSVRGVGGTRNCDWWFTNDAILLDTAGRYATEGSDQQEWLAFLDLLRKYRTDKPLNGLIVAVSVPDIIDANEMQLEEMGKKLRARIDEVMTRLRMQLPVYFLVTKCDLVAGFSEFFGDLRKSERAQALGATLSLKEDKTDPGAVFAREFDLIVRGVHARSCKRLLQERNRVAREAIYQFPIEFAGLRHNLRDLIGQVFMVNAFQGTPIFRGFFFTSGTQEGAPMGRVLQRMGQAMGIRPAQAVQQPRVESKSYFLHDVFMRVVFPDADVAARSASELRRQRLVRTAVAATAFAGALLFALPSIFSYFSNRAFLDETRARAEAAAEIDWESTDPVRQKIDDLDPLLERLQELEENSKKTNIDLMYQGDQLFKPVLQVYIANLQTGFVVPSKYRLEEQLNRAKGERYYQDRRLLKTYLMLSEVAHLDPEWATGRFTEVWAKVSEATSATTKGELKRRMKPHVAHYFYLIKPQGEEGRPLAKPVPANDGVVAKARKTLGEIPVQKRYFSLFVDELDDEVHDPLRDPVRSNLVYPPLDLKTMFEDRPEVLKYLGSKQQKSSQKTYYEVPGPYTGRGYRAVLTNFKAARELLESEAWVIPLTAAEKKPNVLDRDLATLGGTYEQKYIDHWRNFLRDLEIRRPGNIKEAVELYRILNEQEWPFLRVIRRVRDNTQFGKSKILQSKETKKLIERRLQNRIRQSTRGLRIKVDIDKVAGRTTTIPSRFRDFVEFGLPDGGSSKVVLSETPLANYMDSLNKQRSKMVQLLDNQDDPSINLIALDLKDAAKRIDASLENSEQQAKTLLRPLLMNPINVGGQIPNAR
ncbi:MAG: type VI secretion system membrane subunit TssM [Myxococcota bacterium]